MARKVKCFITKEEGTSDTFVKIGNHYYKSQEVYDEDKRQKEERRELIDYICHTFLGYGEGQPFPTSLSLKLKELSYYDNKVILETFKLCSNEISYWLSHKEFKGEYGKIAYMFAIIKDKIADVNRKYIREEKIKAKQKTVAESFTEPVNVQNNTKSGKDISQFLGGEDL